MFTMGLADVFITTAKRGEVMAMPTIQDHIRVLESELCRLKAVQTCCDHIWGDPVFTLYVEKEGCVILYLDPRRGYGAQLTRIKSGCGQSRS